MDIQSIYEYQDVLHFRFKQFLNLDNNTLLSKALFPAYDYCKNDFSKLLKLRSKLELTSDKFDFSSVLSAKNISAKDYALILSNLAEEFYAYLETRLNPKVKFTITGVNPQSLSEWTAKIKTNNQEIFMKPVLRVCNQLSSPEMKQLLYGAYVQGSMSTLDYDENFSDLDLVIIIRKETAINADGLLKLRKNMAQIRCSLYQVDSFQHHGLSIILEQEKEFYNPNYFPPILFDYSTTLFGKKLEFKTRQSTDYSKQMDRFLGYFITIQSHKNYWNKYEWKAYLSRLLLLPSLYLESKDVFCYKRDSFEKIKSYWTEKDLEPVITASQLRLEWHISSFNRIIATSLSYLNNPHWPKLGALISPVLLKNKRDLINKSANLAKKIKSTS